MRTARHFPIWLLAALLAAPCPEASAGGIAQTKHNLSVEGSGESEICIFCHTPHNALPATPLWSRSLSGQVYVPYSSSTSQVLPGQPTYASKLCLSCHDGTIGLVRLRPGAPRTGAWDRVTGRADLGTDLSDDHPVSFVYDDSLAVRDGQVLPPASLRNSPVRLDRHGQVQCTTCHDAHSTPYPKFLVADNAFSRLCTQCHSLRGWTASAHALSPARWNGSGPDPWPLSDRASVAENGCENCHVSHGAGHPERLLREPAAPDVCLACHDGNVAKSDIASEIRKPFRHAMRDTSGSHDPLETPSSMPRHVVCEDCHNPHAVRTGGTDATGLSGALSGVPGVAATGETIPASRYEYEVCFRCHGDSPEAPPPAIDRQIFQLSVRQKLSPTNPSFHPVVALGRNSDVPSLIPPLTENSLISCGDCHASDTVRFAEGPGGVRGPHGSTWRYLLAREYRTADGTGESYQAYSLCYGCHDRASILGNSSFPEHRLHVQDSRTPCSACHDPHGISASQGSAVANTHLINFDRSLAEPDPATGLLRFEDRGNRKGACYLKCHGVAHGPREY